MNKALKDATEPLVLVSYQFRPEPRLEESCSTSNPAIHSWVKFRPFYNLNLIFRIKRPKNVTHAASPQSASTNIV